MTALAHIAMLSHGWRRMLLMLAAGAVAGLSAAPLFLLPALFVALPLLVWTLDGAERRSGWRRLVGPAFRIGFFFGLGYFLVSLHWVGAAFLVDGGVLLALMPFAVLGLCALLALFWGGGTALAHLLWTQGPARIVALAAGLSLAEFARGHLFTGFPFNLLGYALTANEAMMQAASLVGVYGLTFAAVLLASAPALVWPGGDRSLATRLLPLFGALGLIALQLGYGYQRLDRLATPPRDDMVVRIVQPVVPQEIKWLEGARDEIVSRLMDLSAMQTGPGDAGLADVTHLVWPEAALPFYLSEEPEHLARIANMLPQNTLLLTGAPRAPFGADPRPTNAVLAINSDGEVVTSYDKTHLVPFGEFLPFADAFRALGVTQLVHGSQGWAPGDARRLFRLPGGPAFLPLICYEIVYSGGLGSPVAEAEFILVVTNDAWFDGTIGPAQHFHHARLRSVEEGKPMIRAANSGISAIVDPLGRLTGTIAAGQVGTLKGAPSLPVEPTVFSRWRHLPFWLVLGLGLALALVARLAEGRGQKRFPT